MTIAQFTVAMRPAPGFSLNAQLSLLRRRRADAGVPADPGSVSYDTTLVASDDPSEYHSVKRNAFDVDGAFEVLPHTSLKVGFSNLGTDYTHRIWENTTENVFRVSLDTTGQDRFMLRAPVREAPRTGEGFDADALAEVGELATMRHYDVADRDRDRFTLIASVTPGGIVGFNASAGVGRDEYTDSPHGLQSFDSDQYSVGVNVVPDDRTT